MPIEEESLLNKSAVITASGSGIGLEIATCLAEAGADITLNDIDGNALEKALEEIREINPSAEAVKGDGSDPDAMENVINRSVEVHGSLDILVNNLGIAGPTKPCLKLSKEEFMETLEVNLGGMLNATRAAIPYLTGGEYGRVVNISSMSGKRPLKERIPYTTSKMGVIGFTRTLATELAQESVTVNAVCPGSVEGPRLQSVISAQANSQDRAYSDIEAEFKSVSPMNQFVRSSDVATVVKFLCYPATGRITGQDLNVTAGGTMY